MDSTIGARGAGLPDNRIQVQFGPIEGAVDQATRRLAEARADQRIWERDSTLWSRDPQHQHTIANRLGWLTVADSMREQVEAVLAPHRTAS